MEAKELIARRVALAIQPGTLVNLGIGLPSMVANFVSPDLGIFFQAENGVIGLGARPPEGKEDPYLTDAGGGFATAVPGAASIDSVMSFGLIRGGHLDMTVLGGLEVDELGHLANWRVPGKMVPGMFGAMDLVTGAARVIVAMQHAARGQSKIMRRCTLPVTSLRHVDLVVTDLAVIEPTAEGLVLRERAPNFTPADIRAGTEATLSIPDLVPEMRVARRPGVVLAGLCQSKDASAWQGWRAAPGHDQTHPIPLFQDQPGDIRMAVMIYIRFPFLLRNVEDLLDEIGIDICQETARFWWHRFGPMYT